MTAIPSSSVLAGAVAIGLEGAPTMHLRNEARARAPCPVCQQLAFLDPPCTITDAKTGATRVEQNITCTKCNLAGRWKVGQSSGFRIAHGATPCACGCGRQPRPGWAYILGHKPTDIPEMPSEIPPENQPEEKAMQMPMQKVTEKSDVKLCGCGCGQTCRPGRQYAGQSCAGKAKKGKSIPPDVLARRTATIRAARGKFPITDAEMREVADALAHPDVSAAIPGAGPQLLQPTASGIILTYTSEDQEQARQALEWLRRSQDDPYLTVATLAREHTAKTLRNAAALRDLMEAE